MKTFLKIGLLMLSALIFQGFTQKPNDEFAVKYDVAENGWNHSCKFTFYPDSTFTYNITGSNRHTTGTWRYKNRNTIVVNSHLQERKLPMEYRIESAGLEKTTMVVRVHTQDGINPKDYICTPYEDIFPRYVHVDRGSYEIDFLVESVRNTYFEIVKWPLLVTSLGMDLFYYEAYTDKILENSSQGDRITVDIYIDDPLFRYEIFDNKKIKVRKDKIIFKEPLYNTKQHIYIRKD